MYKILKRCRADHKYTCKEMAKMLKISPSYYSQIENGKRKLDYKMAVKIASIFELYPDDIFYIYFEKHKVRIKPPKKLTVVSYIYSDSPNL